MLFFCVIEEWESCSEDEDDDSDGWIDVHHSSDEEIEDKAPAAEEPGEKRRQAQEVSVSRIMTQEDFKRLQTMQIAKEAGLSHTGKSRKRKRPADNPTDR